MACIEICPKEAIRIEDSLRTYNAVIDEANCINCGACRQICQENHFPCQIKPIYWKQGWAQDSKIRKHSSSGGAAAAIETAFARGGGIVCSCVFLDGEFKFLFAKTVEEIEVFKGSKYVKSNPKGIYKKILQYLKEGRKVLFVGLPCQAAAVRNYVGTNDNLYTIDLICHGTPSPQILEIYLSEHQCTLDQIRNISFREKTQYGLRKDEKTITAPFIRDNYTMAFLRSISCTDNCYTCKYAILERVTDITLGDSWGSNLPEIEQRRGISLILCQTEKGLELLQQSNLYLLDVNLECAVAHNHQLRHPSVMPSKRDMFFYGIEKGIKFDKIFSKCYPGRYIKNTLKMILYKLKLYGGGVTNKHLLLTGFSIFKVNKFRRVCTFYSLKNTSYTCEPNDLPAGLHCFKQNSKSFGKYVCS